MSSAPLAGLEARLDLRPAELHLVAADVAHRVVAPALDAVTEEERERIVAEEPLSLLRVLGPEGRDGADAGRVAGERIRALVAQGCFVPVGQVFALHELRRGEHRQLGLVAEVPVAHYDDGLVRPHEATRRHHEETLAAFVEAARMDVSPVALTYRARPDVDELVAGITAQPPDLDVVGWGGLGHRVWLVRDGATVRRLRRAFAAVDQLTIVDGHHRVAAARRQAATQPAATFLAALFPDRDLAFAGYDRCVETDLPPDRLLDELGQVGRLTPLGDAPPRRPSRRTEVLALVDGGWYRLDLTGAPDEVPDGLAVVQLQERVLGPLLGITDPRSDPRLVHVPGTAPLEELVERCRGTGRVAFVLPPITLDELQRVAASGGLLPPKSTYSDPKPGPGVFLRLRPP